MPVPPADRLFRLLCRAGSGTVLAVAGLLVVVLVVHGGPALVAAPHTGLLTSTAWDPDGGRFGALTFVYGSAVTAAVALLVALPVGLGSALFLAEFAPPAVRRAGGLLTELLAAVPGVVVGFWARQTLPPGLGQNLLAAGLVLAVMVLPFVTAAGLEVCRAVPRPLRDGSLALGASRGQTVRRVVLPFARPGLLAVAALALGRAFGETMAVALVVGHADRFDWSPLAPGDTLPGALAKGLPAAADPDHRSALVALAGLLLGMTSLTHLLAKRLARRLGRPAGPGWLPAPTPAATRRLDRGMVAVLAGCQAAALVPLVLVSGFVLLRGAGGLGWDLLTQLPPPLDHPGGVGHAVAGSLLLLGLGAAWAVPAGVLAALDLCEAPGGRWAAAVRGVTDLLAGVPAVVVGVVGYALFVDPGWRPGGFSGWAGGFALGVVLLPLVVRSAEAAVRGVPAHARDASLALGAGRWQTVRRVVLPAAGPAVLAGVLAAAARAAGETAPLLLTARGSNFPPRTPSDPCPSLPVSVYEYSKNLADPDQTRLGWAAALLLLGGVLLLNLLARAVARRRAGR